MEFVWGKIRILCLEHFSGGSSKLHSGTLSTAFGKVPVAALSRCSPPYNLYFLSPVSWGVPTYHCSFQPSLVVSDFCIEDASFFNSLTTCIPPPLDKFMSVNSSHQPAPFKNHLWTCLSFFCAWCSPSLLSFSLFCTCPNHASHVAYMWILSFHVHPTAHCLRDSFGYFFNVFFKPQTP